MNRQVISAIVGATFLSVATLAGAAEPASKPDSTASAGTSPKGAMGMRVYVDPETGALVDRPVTPAQKNAAAAENAQFRQDDTGLKVVTHPDGSISIDLEGRFQMATEAQVSADGSVRVTCNDADHAAQAKHTRAQPIAVAPVRDDR